MKDLAWDPLAIAGVTALIAGLLYLREEAPRWCGFFAAATVVFLTAGVRPLLALAHHPITPGLAALVVMAGAVGAVLMFWLVVFKGHHDKPLIKHKGAPRAIAGAAGQQGAAQQGGRSKNKKTPHHKAVLATVGAMAFMFLLVSNWQAIVQTGGGGISQTVHGITE